MVRKIGRVLVHLFMVVLLVIGVVVNAAAVIAKPILDGFLGTYAADTKQEVLTAYYEEGEQLALQTQEEGIVLVRNENHMLPLSKEDVQVNVFGWAATDWLGSGFRVRADSFC